MYRTPASVALLRKNAIAWLFGLLCGFAAPVLLASEDPSSRLLSVDQILHCLTDAANSFTEGSRNRLEQLCADYNSYIHDINKENENLRNQIAKLSRDHLTQLPNRHTLDQFFSELMKREMAGHIRQPDLNLQWFLMMVDIDHFKSINDTFGHDAGDLVLFQVAQTLQSKLRHDFLAVAIDEWSPPHVGNSTSSQDSIAARFGGEEFAILVQAPSETAALKVAERLRQAVELLNIELDRSQQTDLRSHSSHGNIKVTISLGVAARSVGEDFGLLYKRADQALYEAKNAGRNQVRIHTSVQPQSQCSELFDIKSSPQ